MFHNIINWLLAVLAKQLQAYHQIPTQQQSSFYSVLYSFCCWVICRFGKGVCSCGLKGYAYIHMPPISDEVVEPLPNFKKWGGIVAPPPSYLQGGGWTSNQIFKKGWLERTSTFRGGLLGKRGVTFFRGGGGCNFHIKSKLKSEIFNDKKSWSAKIIFTVITKNSNWEILRFLGFIEKSNFQGGSRKSSIEGRLPKMGSLHSLPI